MELSGRTALVTGATGGIGQALAQALHDAGARLILTGRNEEILNPFAEQLGATAVPADLNQPADIERVIDAAGGADVLVANAGLSAAGALDSFDFEEVQRMIAVNLTAPILLSRSLAPRMTERGGGHLLYVSSVSGLTGQPGSALYSATKFGLRGLAQGLRAELRRKNVGVSCVFPGFVRDAGMFHDAGAKAPWYLGSSSPEDVAAASVHAIRRNRAEVLVAPRHVKAMSRFAAAAPVTAATVARWLGGDKITGEIIGGLAAGSRRD